VKNSPENSSELEQKKFSFDARSTERDNKMVSETDVTVAPTAVEVLASEVAAPVEATTEALEAESRNCLPGGVLAAERQRRGFAISDIANQLFLTEKQILALEEDDYDHFPAAIFVKGYIRNYARLFDLPADPLIELFNAQSTTSAAGLDRVSRTSDRAISRKASLFDPRLIVVAVVTVVLAASLWWATSSNREESVAIDNASMEDGFLTTPPVTVVEDKMMPLQTELEAVPTTVITPVKKVTEPVVEAVPVNVVKEKEAVAEIPPQAEFIADRAVAESFPDTMVLTFSAESWVEITDVNGRRVMFGLGKPGQTRALSGRAPFKVLFGYSPAVAMTFNGEVFDQSSLARGNVAKFTLGNNSE